MGPEDVRRNSMVTTRNMGNWQDLMELIKEMQRQMQEMQRRHEEMNRGYPRNPIGSNSIGGGPFALHHGSYGGTNAREVDTVHLREIRQIDRPRRTPMLGVHSIVEGRGIDLIQHPTTEHCGLFLHARTLFNRTKQGKDKSPKAFIDHYNKNPLQGSCLIQKDVVRVDARCWWVNYRCMCESKRLKHEVSCGTFCRWKREAEARVKWRYIDTVLCVMGDVFYCVFHHGGKFITDGTLKYEGETTTLSFDLDVWNYFVVVSVVKSFGYDNFKQLWYCIRGGSMLKNKLEELIDDTGAMHMANLGRLNGEGEEDGDGVHVNGEVDGDLEEVHEGEEDGDAVEVEVEGHGHVEEFHEVEEDVNGVKGVVEDEVHVCSWSTSTDEGDVHENNECLEGLVDVSVQCDINGDIDGNVEELLIATDSDEEVNDTEGYERFNTFCMTTSVVDFTWEVGTLFTNKQDIIDAVKGYALENGRNIKFVKNDKRRLRMKCFGAKGECPWTIYCAYMEAEKSWQLRTKNDIHTCSREFNLKLLDAKCFSLKSEKTIRENPKMKGVNIREKVQRKWNIGISRCMAYRAKAIASEHIDGSFKEQYKRIYDYAHDLLGRNPGYIVKVVVENNEAEACKDSFVCCRPIIGLDGAFLKGKYCGELLTTIRRDGKDQMLPIAYAMVEGENKDSWSWFLNLLIDDLGGHERFCVRHSYSNFRKKFLSKNMKKLMWRATTVTHPQNWEREMRNTEDVNEDAFKHLIAIPLRYWSRSRFSPTPKCDTLEMEHHMNPMLSLLSRNEFIPSCFMKSTYEETYASIVYPINDNNMWDLQPYPDVMTPYKGVMSRRPKRKRRLEQWEMKKDDSRMTKVGLHKRCGLCRKVGNNKSRCPKATQQLTASSQPVMPSSQLSEVCNGTFGLRSWQKIVVGDVVKVEKHQFFPTDLLLLASSYEDGICYLEIMNLDGETNFKVKRSLEATLSLDNDQAFKDFSRTIYCEDPNPNLYTFIGNFEHENQVYPLDPSQILLKHSKLMNTDHVYGVVIFTGHDSKVMQNSTKFP
ncbi:hypothetical protein V8G54_015060 [Vigna mungo]|uniref:Transposase MuDR plant domain-containing protein n=1 Tax=Vigna mungo TaxID=3915 RepID=A0AAQ3NHS7_VIGMU